MIESLKKGWREGIMPELKWIKDKDMEEIREEVGEKEIVRLEKWGKKVEDKPIQRVPSGIPGLDPFMENGFPKGSNIVVSGLQGTGKTAFAIQFIAEGCKKGERCLYMTAEQSPPSIIKQALQFQMPYQKWEEQGNLQFAYLNFKKPLSKHMFDFIIRTIESDPWDRLVMDSLSALFNAPFSISYYDIMEFFEKTTQHGVTTVYITQKDEKDRTNELLGYIGDGLIDFEASAVGETENRTMQIKKLRWTKTNILKHPFEFTENGISLI